MVNEYTKSNTGKLLAAIVAMLMVVCAVAVVAMPSASADAPENDFKGAQTDDVDELADFKATNGVVTVSSATIYNITKNIGTPDAPVNLSFNLGANVQFTTANDSKIYIKATSSIEGASSTFMFTAENVVLEFNGIEAYVDANISNGSVFNMNANDVNAAVYVTNGATLNVAHESGASTWMGPETQDTKSSWLVITGASATDRSTVNFNNTNSMQELAVIATNGDLNIASKVTGMVLEGGSTFDNSTVDVTSAGYNGFQVKGTVTLKNGSSFDVAASDSLDYGSSGIGIAANDAVIDVDETSSINANSIGFLGSTSTAKITGAGDVSATFELGTQATAGTFTLEGVTVTGNSTVDTGITVAASGENGFTVDGNLRNKGTVDTSAAPIEVTGKFTNTADGTVKGTNGITGSGTVVNDGTMNAPVEVADYQNNATADLVVYGDSTGSQWYPAKQNITVPAGQTWTIIDKNIIVIPGTLNVEGSLVIEEGGVLVVGGINTADPTRTGFGTTTVEDTLTVEDGGILAVAYGNLNVNGTANIDGKVYIGYGYQTTAATGEPAVAGYEGKTANLNLNSNTTFSETSTIKAASGKVVVEQDVTLTIEGAVKSDLDIANSGAVVFDSEPLNADGTQFYLINDITISMAADGASVSIENLAIGNANNKADVGQVFITDLGLAVDNKGKEVTTADENKITINSGLNTAGTGTPVWDYPNCVISGLTVVENFDGVKKATDTEPEKILNTMDISGNLSASAEKDAAFGMFVWTNSGDFTISDAGENTAALTVGDNVTLYNSARLTVSGYVPVSTDKDDAGTIAIDAAGEITLAGNGHIYMSDAGIVSSSNFASTTVGINATYYETTVGTDDFANYVTFDAALAAANADSTIDELTLLGENKLTASATMPAITLTFDDKSGATLSVGDKDNRDVVLTVTADADYGAEGATTVYGTVFFNDRRDLKNETNMISDVKSYEVDAEGKEVKNGWARYTNIYTAMAEAEAGDVITVSKAVDNPTDPKDGYVQLTSDFTVKTGVTVVIPDEPNVKGIMVMDGVTLTVAGTLQSDVANGVVAESAFAKNASNEKDKETSAIIVTGTLKVVDDVEYAATNPAVLDNDLLTEGSYISGAYYYDGEYYYVSPLSVAVNDLADVINDIVINGAVTEGDVTFTATDECDEIIINTGAQLTLSSLTLANGGVLKNVDTALTDDDKVVTSGWFTGTVIVGDASIEAVKVTGLNVTSENGLVIAGAVVDYVEPTDKAEKQVASLTAVAGTVIVDQVTGDMTVGENATVTIPNVTTGTVNTNGNVDGALTVLGTVSIAKGQALSVDEMYVAGTVNVAEETDTDAAGTLVIGAISNGVADGTLFVGMDEDFEVIGADAAVNGPVNCTTIYAAAGTAVSEATADAETFDNSTEYYVEGALWMTAYTQDDALPVVGSAANAEKITKAVPVENAWFDGTWLDADGKELTTTNSNVGQIDAVYADVEYDIYIINLRADQNAISSISIDGNLMQFGLITDKNGSWFYGYTAVVDAGAHTIQYQLANGYSGDGVLTVNGTEMSDLTFTAEGTPGESEYTAADGKTIEYNLQLTGFEKSGYVPDSPDTGSDSGDSGMTITDYLLIVLVVLIIVMAIIVAMRLMRS